MDSSPIVIVGAGAAGLMAAIHAASAAASPPSPPSSPPSPARRVLLLERTRDGGRKILVSGGGRCNVLPSELDESRFVTDSSPNSMKKMLRSWPLAEQRRFFEDELGIPLRREAETGKLFPASDRARDVRDALLRRARELGVELRFESTVTAIDPLQEDEARWRIGIERGEPVDAHAVVLATGGISVPNTGSDGIGLAIARRLGHEIHEPYAALTPLTDEAGSFRDLAGISLVVTLEAQAGRRTLRSRGGFLFTHRGYSGPALLDLSHLAVRSRSTRRALPAQGSRSVADDVAAPKQKIFVQWTTLTREDWERELAPRRAGVAGLLRAQLPQRLADRLLELAKVPPDRSLAELRSDERRRLVETLTHFELPWTGHEGYRTAEVTGGGVALSEVDARTLESRRARGLFFCGEMLDAFGPIGGYNFLWAWATGRAAGLGAATS